MHTSRPKQDTVSSNIARTTALAMHAVARHGIDHRLPAPSAIRRPRPGDRAVRVDLVAGEHDAWVEATNAEYLRTDTIGEHARSVSVKWTGTVPSPVGDIAVELRIVQRARFDEPRTLTLVPDGAA